MDFLKLLRKFKTTIEKFMKIYFGRMAEIEETNLVTDAWLYDKLQTYSHEELGILIEQGTYDEFVLHTFSILLLNFLRDEYAMENVYYMKEGVLTNLRDDDHITRKMEVMGPGEALCDSYYR